MIMKLLVREGCAGVPAFTYAAETALTGSTATIALFQRSRFVSLLRRMGLPEEVSEELCSSVVIDDDMHCLDPE